MSRRPFLCAVLATVLATTGLAASPQAAHAATLQALEAQNVVIQSLAEELRASRETTNAAPAPTPSTPSPKTDRPPAAKKKASWYFGK